ncbi:unnamed protein product [Bursaphelenchus okinawaensis]|uniref:FAD/NAD(P)-binding domain-containing protein n=1 Tax=Bursaphelenchus okinawaensis TaxID=465554 RepID=A0A811KCR1_9BILA|nr:unnamed protein product [Bursaphelenchus okinawaensis]CAG9098688.1 unnamed protein product [Bursaphelenchus okinawaensis]
MKDGSRIVVVGGGIAGVSCIQHLADSEELPDSTELVLVCGKNGYVKRVTNYEKAGIVMEKFQVEIESASTFTGRYSKVTVIEDTVISWDSNTKTLKLSSGEELKYDKLVIATGAEPKTLNFEKCDKILTIRDTDTIAKLEKRLCKAKRVAIVGDGGIGMELAFELKNQEITWVLKEVSVGSMFFDVQVAIGLERGFETGRIEPDLKDEAKYQRYQTSEADTSSKKDVLGCSLGPFWLGSLHQPSGAVGTVSGTTGTIGGTSGTACNKNSADSKNGLHRKIDIKRGAKVTGYGINNDEITVKLSDGTEVTVDLVIEAMGVWPASKMWKESCNELQLAEDGGIIVYEHMKTTVDDVYACGDVCTVKWEHQSKLWRQMRLWTQARQFGQFTALNLIEHQLELDQIFDIFAHTTTFAGQKVILLGDFDAKDGEIELEYVNDYVIRTVIRDNKVVGTCLIGETDCADMFEQLIVTELDVSKCPRPISNQYGDIVDYFD